MRAVAVAQNLNTVFSRARRGQLGRLRVQIVATDVVASVTFLLRAFSIMCALAKTTFFKPKACPVNFSDIVCFNVRVRARLLQQCRCHDVTSANDSLATIKMVAI